jgi:hypothetical protein
VADGLSKLLQHEVRQGGLHELHICRRAPGISQLLFADDTLLFFEASEDQAVLINKVLRYEEGTNQLINPSKCSIMFGSACPEENQEKVKAVLKVRITAQEEKYLGLPTPEGRTSKERFKSPKERLSKKFSSWAERYMSGGSQRSDDKIYCSGDSNLCHGGVQAATNPVG